MVRWNEFEDEWNSHSLTSTGMNIVNDDSTRNKVPYFFSEPNARMSMSSVFPFISSKPKHLRFLRVDLFLFQLYVKSKMMPTVSAFI